MEKQSVFETVIEWINWIKIVLSPTILSAIIGVAIYLSMENKTTGIFLLVFINAIGFGLGILWANKIKKKHGSTHFISRTDASPDIDDIR
ncbi:hypothetical protein [Kaistella montana]|uniref:Uncharacterized protein n=1 Tax=Kaistella montana TaxID=1849733 RepID=A0ABW5K7X1_9FLAO|nr:hypothetical protein [Kaistella montana]MCQ4034551.1 hypothetical protein [Kaistella montana]